jgi:putative addiction module component (TIGR02574 family)
MPIAQGQTVRYDWFVWLAVHGASVGCLQTGWIMDKLLIDNVLRLDAGDRLQLIDVLIQSLDEPDAAIEKAWLDEAVRRSDEIDAGTATLIDGEKVFERYR